MATGIQTSVQRGRRSQLSAQPSKQSPWSKAFSLWGGLSRKVQYGLGAAVLALILGVSFKTHDVRSNQYGDLYPLKLNSEDVTEISTVLINSGIDHTIPPTMDGIQLHPQDLLKARALLAGHSLPRHQPEPPKDNTSMPTADMRKAEERRRLESELVYTLRQMDGVNNARVKIALPPRTYFMDDRLDVKASVFLDLAQGYEVSPEVARGMASLISHSVPELTPENVTLLDDNGTEIAIKPLDDMDLITEREMELQNKLQGALMRIFGDRVHAVVNVELDTSQDEHRSFTPGSPEHKGVITDSSQFFEEMLEGDKEDKQYGITKEARNYVYAQNTHVNLRMKPKISRITATVLVDGASAEEVEAISGIVKGSIGIDETRADQVFVTGLPWNHKVWEDSPEAPLPAAPSAEPSLLLQALGLGVGMFLLGLVGAGFLNRRTKPVLGVALNSAENHSVNGIVDHHNQKNGHHTTLDATACNGSRMEALESLVHARPEKVADLLRTTWLKQ